MTNDKNKKEFNIMLTTNQKSLKNISLRTLPGLVIGLILFSFPFPFLPVLLLPICLPILFFLRAVRQEMIAARPILEATVAPTPQPIIFKKTSLPVQLLKTHELAQFYQLIERKDYPERKVYKIKLQQYEDFFEKQSLSSLEDLVTIEGISKNSRWTKTVEREVLQKSLFSKETLNDKELSLRNFLVSRTTKVTHCYDGYPMWLYHFSLHARNLMDKVTPICHASVLMAGIQQSPVGCQPQARWHDRFNLINPRKNPHRGS